MYYEERQIDGIWHWRGTPTGEWICGRPYANTQRPAMTPTAPVDVKRLRGNADFLERKGWSKSAVLEREAADEIERLRTALTAAESLLRDVGTGGRFNLAAENSDEADEWYAKRDALLAQGEQK